MPRLALPKWGSRPDQPPSRNEPSMTTRISEGTKDLYGKTKGVLMQWTNKKKSTTFSKKAEKKESFLTSWLPKKEEKKQPKTVKDFLSQPRPGF